MVQLLSHSVERTIDAVATARERQDVRIDLLREQVDRAIDALIATRLGGADRDLDATRRVLFDLYDNRIVTKAQVRERGALTPDEFHEHLRGHRLRYCLPRSENE